MAHWYILGPMARGSLRITDGRRRLWLCLAGAAVCASSVLGRVPIAGAQTEKVICVAGATTLCNDTVLGEAAWTVPDGVSKALFTVYGGSGGNSLRPGGGHGGGGGEVSATFNLTPGQVFQLYVGQGGGDGPNVSHNGGGTLINGCEAGYWAGPAWDGCGGVESNVASPLSGDAGPRILITAGGGGGGGGNFRGGDGGGITGTVAPAAPSGGGGTFGGGGASATEGGAGGGSFDGHAANPSQDNGAGGQGYGPVTFEASGITEFRFQTPNHGGAAAGGNAGGGGGGAGYYAGGGGGNCSSGSEEDVACGTGGGGGGGGSAYVDPSATTVTGFDGGNHELNGRIEITYGEAVSNPGGETPPSKTTGETTPQSKSTGAPATGSSTYKPLTQAQKLAKALKACKKEKPKSKRKGCEAQAKKRYEPKAKKRAKSKKKG
jgi:hypothetical protein